MLQGIATQRAFGRSREQAETRDLPPLRVPERSSVVRSTFQAASCSNLAPRAGGRGGKRLMGGGVGVRVHARRADHRALFVPLRRFAAATRRCRRPGGREPGSSRSWTHRQPRAGTEESVGGLPVEASAGPRGYRPARRLRRLRNAHCATYDLVLPAGRRTARSHGESGAGKSTLAAVLRLRRSGRGPDHGREKALGDDINVHAWRGRIAYVPQSPHLFHGTVGENIRLARPDATLDEGGGDAGADGVHRGPARRPRNAHQRGGVS